MAIILLAKCYKNKGQIPENEQYKIEHQESTIIFNPSLFSYKIIERTSFSSFCETHQILLMNIYLLNGYPSNKFMISPLRLYSTKYCIL